MNGKLCSFMHQANCHMFDIELFCSTVQPIIFSVLFVCVEGLRPSQPNGVMSSAVSLTNHTFTGQA